LLALQAVGVETRLERQLSGGLTTVWIEEFVDGLIDLLAGTWTREWVWLKRQHTDLIGSLITNFLFQLVSELTSS